MSEERFLLAYEAWLRCGKPGQQPAPEHYGVTHDVATKVTMLHEAHDPDVKVPQTGS